MSWSVLVVDDEEETQKLIRVMLESHGFEISTAMRGKEAIEKIKQKQPDVVLLDLMMPDMDGIDVCIQLRNDPATADLPIIMLTVLGTMRDVWEGMQAGATKYITKPMSRDTLVAALNEVLESTHPNPSA